MANMIVSGAGTSEVNGTYIENGTLNGKPLYILDGQGSYPRIYWSDAWLISTASTYKGTKYSSTDNVDTPDLCTTWIVGAWGTSPAPTVTAGGGGSTGVPKQFMHYARLRSNQ